MFSNLLGLFKLKRGNVPVPELKKYSYLLYIFVIKRKKSCQKVTRGNKLSSKGENKDNV